MRFNPVTREMAAQARRMRAEGMSYHLVASELRANPQDVRNAVIGETFCDLLDPPPVPEPKLDRHAPKEDRYWPGPQYDFIGGEWVLSAEWSLKEVPRTRRAEWSPAPRKAVVPGLYRGFIVTVEDIELLTRTVQGQGVKKPGSQAKSKLSPAQREEILLKYQEGTSQTALAREYGVGVRTVARVIAAFKHERGEVRAEVVHISAARSHKLTLADARAIRAAHANGTRQAELARQYGVSSSRISDIVHHKSWKESA